METSRSTLTTMRLPLLLLIQLSFLLQTEAQVPSQCVTSSTNRPPEQSDLTVDCGNKYIDLSIFICPIYNSNYNESQMVLNNQINSPECFGTVDWVAVPPVLQFRIPLNESISSACKSLYKVVDHMGTGAFSGYSLVQTINISGEVLSVDRSQSMISYSSMILYRFSCQYPMQYVVNNTKLAVSGVDVIVRDNNSTFISTLEMALYSDATFTQVLVIPPKGLNLKTKIFVRVMATNLTDRFHVILDRCYTSTSPDASAIRTYDLFVGCVSDAQTFVISNGESQVASFSFEAFRFVIHKNTTVSIFYLHCVTRLCDVDNCQKFLPKCNTSGRRKRDTEETEETEGVTESAVISSPAIIVKETGTEESSDAVGLVVPVVFTWTMMSLSLGVTFSLTSP